MKININVRNVALNSNLLSVIQTRIEKTMETMVKSEVSKEPDLFDGI